MNLGVRPNDRLLVHSSMKAVGLVAGGADTVLDVLADYLSDGLLLLPTHTWEQWNNPEGIFDPLVEPSCVGILSERFRQRAGVVRSWHPTHSIAGLGATAAAFLAGEENTRSPCPRTGCWGRLYDVGARILFLGAPLRTNTYLHSVEEWHRIPDRLAAQPTLFRIARRMAPYSPARSIGITARSATFPSFTTRLSRNSCSAASPGKVASATPAASSAKPAPWPDWPAIT